jgi:hypothetical protein
MNIGEILIWESFNPLLLIPIVIGLVMLVRWFHRRVVFTERDWLPVRKSSHWRLCSGSLRLSGYVKFLMRSWISRAFYLALNSR